jgi:nicotinamide-nucleotide amidase
MRVEVVAVGTELLLGQIVDTNSSWIGQTLAEAGIDCLRQTKVGDNHDRIVAVLREALERADAVICCGGLGPTADDLTRDALAEVMGAPLELDDEVAERIEAMFATRGRDMPVNNLRQAEVPRGARTMAEQPGTAPGLVCPVGDQVVYAVPGVPYEMQQMVSGTVLEDLRARGGGDGVIRSRVLRTWGVSESRLDELLAPHVAQLDRTGHATIAFLASGWEGLKVRITARADSVEEADAILDTEALAVADVLGPMVFSDDDQPMEAVVTWMLADRGLTMAAAESVTGGLVAARMSAAPGASEVFRGGVVAYDSQVKFDLLGVPEGPVVSEEAVVAMAEGVCRVIGADVGVATSGVAGPTTQEGVPVGTVWLATCVDGEAEAHLVRLPGDRERIRQFAVISVLDLLRRRLAP